MPYTDPVFTHSFVGAVFSEKKKLLLGKMASQPLIRLVSCATQHLFMSIKI